jgi:hypothetical protein
MSAFRRIEGRQGGIKALADRLGDSGRREVNGPGTPRVRELLQGGRDGPLL